jgi:hypothetical protein
MTKLTLTRETVRSLTAKTGIRTGLPAPGGHAIHEARWRSAIFLFCPDASTAPRSTAK